MSKLMNFTLNKLTGKKKSCNGMKTKLQMKCSNCAHWNRVPVDKIFIEQPSIEPKVKALILM